MVAMEDRKTPIMTGAKASWSHATRETGVGRVDAAGEEVEPGSRHGAEDEATVEGHAAGTREIMLLQPALLDELLGGDIASREQNRRSDGLCEKRPGGKLAVVPTKKSHHHFEDFQGSLS